MAYIKKLKDNELIGGTDNTDMYPVTSTEAVYNPEGVTQEYINNHIDGSKIVDGTITNNKIADSTISMGKLDNDVQTKIQQGTQKAWNPRGAYNENTVYGVNDLVYHTDTNSSYISLQANNQGHNPAWQSATGGWWMKVLDGSYVNVMVDELEQAIAQAIEDAQDDISELISDSQATINAAVSGANSAAQAANTAAANAEAKIDWVEKQVDSLTAYEVATALDETSIIPVQNKVVSKEINNANAYLKTDVRTLAVGQTYTVDEAVKTTDGKMLRMTKEIKSLNLADTIAIGELKIYSNATYRALKAIVDYNNATTYADGDYAVGRPAVVTITVDTIGLVAGGNINVSVAGAGYVIAVTTTSTAASVAADIVEAVGTIEGWTITDNEDGTITIKCDTAGANTLAFSFTDTDETGVVVSAATVAGATTISVYDGSSWSAATLANMVADTTLFESKDVAWLEANATRQDSVTEDINEVYSNLVNGTIDITHTLDLKDNCYFSYANVAENYLGVHWNGRITQNTNMSLRIVSLCDVPVKEGHTYFLTATRCWTTWGSIYPLVCLLNANNYIVAYTHSAVIGSANRSPITIPAGVVRMHVMYRTGYPIRLEESTTEIKNYIDNIVSGIWKTDGIYLKSLYTPSSNCYVNVAPIGVAPSLAVRGDSNRRHITINCTEGEIYYLNVIKSSERDICIWSFHDANNIVVSISNWMQPFINTSGSNEVYNNILIVPKGAVKLVINGDSRYTFDVYPLYTIRDAANVVLDGMVDKFMIPTIVKKTSVDLANVTLGDTVVLNPASGVSINYYCYAFTVSPNKVIRLGYVYMQHKNIVIILDSEGSVIYATSIAVRHLYDSQILNRDKVLVMPANAATLLISSRSTGNPTVPSAYDLGDYKYYLSKSKGVLGIDETWKLSSYYVFSSLPEVGTSAPPENLVNGGSYVISGYFKCQGGDIYTIKSNIDGLAVSAAIMNSNYVVLANGYDANGNLNIKAPANAVYIYIAINQNGIASLTTSNGVVYKNNKLEQQSVDILRLQSNTVYPYDFIVPPTIYGVAGYRKCVYQDTLIRGLDDGLNSPSGMFIEISTNNNSTHNFAARARCARVTPSSAGNYTMRFEAYNSFGIKVKDKSINFKVSAATGLSSAHNVTIVGDSLTEGGQIAKYTRDRFTALGGVVPTFVGSKTSTVDGETIKHEGKGGVRLAYYSGTSSPYYIGGKLDISAYKSANNISGNIDLVVICLGVNDAILGSTGNANDLVPVINAFLEDSPNCRFIIQLTPSDANTQGGGWTVYGGGQRYKMSYNGNIWAIRQKLLDKFDTPAWNNVVYIGDAIVGLDRYWGYPYELSKDSTWSPETEFRHTNSVHPNNNGYRMLGDGYFFQMLAVLKDMESSAI